MKREVSVRTHLPSPSQPGWTETSPGRISTQTNALQGSHLVEVDP